MSAKEKVREIDISRLTPLAVTSGWDVLFLGLRNSGMFDDDTISSLLHQAACGKVDVWILKKKEDESTYLLGIIVTKVYTSPYGNESTFTLLHAHVIDTFVTVEAWMVVFKELTRFAKSRGCSVAEIYTDNARAQELLGKFGFAPIGVYRKAL